VHDSTSAPFADVGLFLTSGSVRDVSRGTRTEVGLVRIGAWQIDRVPGTRHTGDVYVVRVTLNLRLEPGVGGPRWLEAGFFFADTTVNVLDAVPLRVDSAEAAKRYTLTSLANFVAVEDGPAPEFVFPLGPQQPTTVVSDLNNHFFRWRYSSADDAGLAPGGRDGWFVLLVPPGTRRLVVRPRVAYELIDDLGLRPEADHPECVVELPGPANDGETDGSGARPSQPPVRNSGLTLGPTSGLAKLAFVRRLGDSWADLADVLEIPYWDRAGFPTDDRPRAIWEWLETRNRLETLPGALELIGRRDLIGGDGGR
jgi:bDLD-like protein